MKVVKQKTIGLNPLEEYLSINTQQSQEHASVEQIQEQGLGAAHVTHEINSETLKEPQQSLESIMTSQPIKKQRITLHVPIDIVERVKNAVFWEPGLTLAGFAEYALAIAIDAMEQERGAPFPDRKIRHLRGGRPLK